MGLLETITRLQQKSLAERRRVALGISFIATFLIAIIWGSITVVELSGEGSDGLLFAVEERGLETGTSPFETLSAVWGGFGSSFSDFFGGSGLFGPLEYRRGE